MVILKDLFKKLILKKISGCLCWWIRKYLQFKLIFLVSDLCNYNKYCFSFQARQFFLMGTKLEQQGALYEGNSYSSITLCLILILLYSLFTYIPFRDIQNLSHPYSHHSHYALFKNYHIPIHPIPIMLYSKFITSLFTPFPLCFIQNLSHPYSPHSLYALFKIYHIPIHPILIMPFSNFVASLITLFQFCHIQILSQP